MIFSPIEADQVDSLIAQECNAGLHPWTISKLMGSLAAAAADCYAIHHEARVIGYWVVQRVVDEAELLNFVIFKPYQAKGYGQRVLKKLCAMLQKQGIKRVFLEVRETNTNAQALYRKAGFSLIANRLNYYPVGDSNSGRKQGARVMRRKL